MKMRFLILVGEGVLRGIRFYTVSNIGLDESISTFLSGLLHIYRTFSVIQER